MCFSEFLSLSRQEVALVLSVEEGEARVAKEAVVINRPLATTMSKQPKWLGLASIVAPPLLIIVGGLAGAGAASAVAAAPALHTGLISFGVAALLYLVTEELLLEAHESQGDEEHVWWVDLMFFVGFFGAFLLEKFTPE